MSGFKSNEVQQNTRYVLPVAVSAEGIKAARQRMGLTQAVFAEFLCVSKKTVERWESGTEAISGPIVPLLAILAEDSRWEERFRVPAQTAPLRLWYLWQDRVCSILDVDERLRKVKVYNFTEDLLYRAFGREEHPTFEEYEEFLESRCFPRSRDKMKLELEHLKLPFYDPILIIEKTQGRMAEDDFWIRIERAQDDGTV